MVITAKGSMGTACQLEKILDEAACSAAGIALESLIGSMTELIALSDARADDFLDPDNLNTLGKLKALAEGVIFQACKPIGGGHLACPIKMN